MICNLETLTIPTTKQIIQITDAIILVTAEKQIAPDYVSSANQPKKIDNATKIKISTINIIYTSFLFISAMCFINIALVIKPIPLGTGVTNIFSLDTASKL